MNLPNKLPSFYIAFYDLYSGSPNLLEQTYEPDSGGQPPMYQGISVKALGMPLPVYHNQSEASDSDDYSLNLLNEYGIEPLTDTTGFFGTDAPDMQKTVIDKDIPWNSGNEPVNDMRSTTLNIPFIQQVSLPESAAGISEPTPASPANPDYRLTHLPFVPSSPQVVLSSPQVVPSSPQDLQPVTVVNPLNLNQTTSDKQTPPVEKSVDSNSAKIERPKKLLKDPGDAERKNERRRARMRELRKDPAYQERQRERQRARMRERRKDPAYLERERKRRREHYRNNPDYAESLRARKRERYKNEPGYADKAKKCSRDRHKNDPIYAERRRKRELERYHNNHAHAKRQKELQKEPQKKRPRNNPNHAVCKRRAYKGVPPE